MTARPPRHSSLHPSVRPPGPGSPKTSSSASSGPKPPVQLSSSITLSDSAQLVGRHTIVISSESVVHPRARLDSGGGRVVVGRRCLVSERCWLGAPGKEGAAGGKASGVGGAGTGGTAGAGEGEAGGQQQEKKSGILLGDYVSIEVNAVVETGGTHIDEGSIVGVGARVGAGAEIGKYCTLSPYTTVAAGERIPDYTVLFGDGMRRIDGGGLMEARNRAQTRQIEVLKRMVKSDPSKFQS